MFVGGLLAPLIWLLLCWWDPFADPPLDADDTGDDASPLDAEAWDDDPPLGPDPQLAADIEAFRRTLRDPPPRAHFTRLQRGD